MKKKLISLAKELDFNSETDYFNYLIDSHINGNFRQCQRLFSEMRKGDQKHFLLYCSEPGLEKIYRFYFGQL